MRRSVTLWTSMVAVLAASTLIGGAHVAQSGEFNRQNGPDFDCDGVRDRVFADTSTTINGVEDAGAVTVTYSTSGRSQRISQATTGVPNSPEFEDRFGESYTWYDRNRDGCDDLVVGAPGESVGRLAFAGSVTIIPGASSGLATSRSVEYTQDSPGFPDRAEDGDWFGYALAAGRTNQGAPYLLIGSRFESGPDFRRSSHGSVYYLRGSTISLIHQDTPGVAGTNENGDSFGETLAATERFFVVGSPGETVGSAEHAGMVHVFSHTFTDGRPTPIGSFHQDTSGITDTSDRGDLFGSSLSVLSYRPTSGHPIGALVAVGTPLDSVGGVALAGIVHLVYVSPSGAVRQQFAITQNTAGVTDNAERADFFGDDVVLANLHPASNVATPATLAWAVASSEVSDGPEPIGGGVHAFRPGWGPGDPDIWLRDLLGIDAPGNADLRSSDTRLFMGSGSFCTIVAWRDLLDGGTLQSEFSDLDDCAG